jgi:hypothetical protein
MSISRAAQQYAEMKRVKHKQFFKAHLIETWRRIGKLDDASQQLIALVDHRDADKVRDE